MTNKKLGNDFETEFCQKLSEYGFWVHNFTQDKAGQPSDVIAVKNKKAYLIDCKVCSEGGFDLRRVEENQDLSMELWNDCGNGLGWFAIKLAGQIYMISHYMIKAYRNQQSSLSPQEIFEMGMVLDKWVKKCK